jgi:hypothetical protein
MQHILNLLEAQGYQQGGDVLRFEGGGRPTVEESKPVVSTTQKKEEPFVEPSWVATAPKVIGTAVEPVYPQTRIVHDGNLAEDRSSNPIGYRFDNGKSQYVYLDLNGNVTEIRNRGNFVDDITSFAAMVPGPWQPFAQGYRAIKAIDKGDIAGGAASLAGLGGYSDVAQYLRAAKALESKDPLAILSAAGNLSGNQDIKDISKGITTAKDLSKGDLTGLINTVGSYTGNQDLKDVGSALQVANTIKNAITTGTKLPSAVISLLDSGLPPESKEVVDAFLSATKKTDALSLLQTPSTSSNDVASFVKSIQNTATFNPDPLGVLKKRYTPKKDFNFENTDIFNRPIVDPDVNLSDSNDLIDRLYAS